MLELLTGYKLIYLFAIICTGLAVSTETAGLLLLRYFIDKIIVPKNWSVPFYYLFAGFVLIAIFRGVFSFLRGRASARASESVARNVRNILFDHIQRQSFSYHDKTPTGELIQRSTSDVNAIRLFFSHQVMDIFRIIFLAMINFTAIFLLHWKLALVSIAVAPLIVLVSKIFFSMISKAYKAYQEQGDRLSTVLQENLSGIRIVKAFARQDFEQRKFDRVSKEELKRGKKLAKYNAMFWPFGETICGLQILAGIAVGGVMAMNGTITIGTYSAYTGMVGLVIWPLQHLGRLIVQLSTSFVSYRRIVDVIRHKQEDLTSGLSLEKARLNGEVIFNHVSFEYKKDIPVLRDVSFTCKSGQVIALLGEAGSGKTTLINLLPRFYDYTNGEILLDGKPLKTYSRYFLRRNIGIVEQEPFMFSMRIKDNITYGIQKKVSTDKIIQAAKAAAVHKDIMSFPGKYNTIVGEKGVTLSGGQKQRLAIARTLLKDPSILILDDSTSSIDARTEEEIRKALEKLMKSRTTFIIAHRIQSLMKADLILVFKDGRIIQKGIHKDLIAVPGFYRHIFNIQTQMEKQLKKEVKHA